MVTHEPHKLVQLHYRHVDTRKLLDRIYLRTQQPCTLVFRKEMREGVFCGRNLPPPSSHGLEEEEMCAAQGYGRTYSNSAAQAFLS